MNEINTINGKINILTVEEIISLHSILCDNYKILPEMEPITPVGIKDEHMLESAVSRQFVGSGDYYKYNDVYLNCATLVYGLVKNHSFHNGNKRIGFLALLKHLYTNGYVIKANIRHMEIYDLLRELASNNLCAHAITFTPKFFKTNPNKKSWDFEAEIKYIAFWLKNNTEYKNRKVKQKTIALSELSAILNTKKLVVNFSGKYFTVAKQKSFLQEILNTKVLKRDYIIKDTKNIPLSIVEQIRSDFAMSFNDGVDNISFYNDEDFLNDEIVSYKKIIYKLAKT